MDKDKPVDYSQPVAYDRDGRPLYAHPPKPSRAERREEALLHHAVHISRAAEPVKPKLSEETKRRHKESVTRYPRLNLSDGEYVIKVIRRHPIGIFGPVGLLAGAALLIVAGLVSYPFLVPSGKPTFGAVLVPALLLLVLIGLFSYIVSWVYWKNRFILTNESIIQEIQHSLFAQNEQTVSLANVEDVSYTRHGIVQILFDYGSIRLSTEGEETTYRFPYVANPKKQTAILHNAVEAFKNGRPVTGD